MSITRAISIRQPFVEQIQRGTKKYEFRTTTTKLRERVYIYASQKPKDRPSEWRKVGKELGELPAGLIVGTVEIVDCKFKPDGEYAYRLSAPKRLKKHLRPTNQPQRRNAATKILVSGGLIVSQPVIANEKNLDPAYQRKS